jgi:NAD(P)H-hydrate repair Nnr-like enzyme with NAD(P)H-hydrate epimerase domain
MDALLHLPPDNAAIWRATCLALCDELLLAVAFAAGLIGAAVAAADRVALVVGNGGYSFATRLANPANDAADVAKALREIGFDVVEGILQVGMPESLRHQRDRRALVDCMAGVGMAGPVRGAPSEDAKDEAQRDPRKRIIL